jgi:hypothetical protein
MIGAIIGVYNNEHLYEAVVAYVAGRVYSLDEFSEGSFIPVRYPVQQKSC